MSDDNELLELSDSEDYHPSSGKTAGTGLRSKKKRSESDDDFMIEKVGKSKPRGKKLRKNVSSSDEEMSDDSAQARKKPSRSRGGRLIKPKPGKGSSEDEAESEDEFNRLKSRSGKGKSTTRAVRAAVIKTASKRKNESSDEELDEKPQPVKPVSATKPKVGPASKTRKIGNGTAVTVTTLSSDENEPSPTLRGTQRGGGTKPSKLNVRNSESESDHSEHEKKIDSKHEMKEKVSGPGDEDKSDDSEEDEAEFVVDKILDKKIDWKGKGRNRKKTTLYYLSWRGFGPDENSWEPEENLFCKDMIAEFEEKLKAKAKEETAAKAKVVEAETPTRPSPAKYRAGPASRVKRVSESSPVVTPTPTTTKKLKKDVIISSDDERIEDSDLEKKEPEELKTTTEDLSLEKKEPEPIKEAKEDLNVEKKAPEPKKMKAGPASKKQSKSEVAWECLHCAKTFEKARGKKWSLATELTIDAAPLNVYEGLNTFYTHYKGGHPLAQLEPIGTLEMEDRRLCDICGKAVEEFIVAMHSLTVLSDKKSKLSEMCGDLEAEKADWKGLLDGDDILAEEMELEDEKKDLAKILDQEDTE